jgi:hypothetical protein
MTLRQAGIDGLIVVDLPPEEDEELCIPAQNAGLNFIRLATPTTDDKRLPKVLQNTSGFVYYVSITGITGAAEAQAGDVGPEVARIKSQTDLPVIVGFGIKTPERAQGNRVHCGRGRCGFRNRQRIGCRENPRQRFWHSLNPWQMARIAHNPRFITFWNAVRLLGGVFRLQSSPNW